MPLVSCDTFVVLPPLTAHGGIIFGKNSDRPRGEVQEIDYIPSKNYSKGERLQCTYIEIDQVSATRAVLLSKPAWMWGAEMGANDCGVVIGNEAVFTKVDDGCDERLLGMDLVRLGLERGGSALEALSAITSLLEAHGQGGPCSDIIDMTYHNSFLIADQSEAWILETAGRLWAAESLKEGFRNISNSLSINTKIDKMSSNVKSYAIDNNLWDGKSDFNFATAYMSGSPCDREASGKKLLQQLTADKAFTASDMMTLLRDKESTICRPRQNSFPSASSQVTVFARVGSGKPHCHWLTGTPDPSTSIFKPFIFTPNVNISQHTLSPKYKDDPAKEVPRFKWKVQRDHTLYALHAVTTCTQPGIMSQLRQMEQACIADVDTFISAYQPGQSLAEVDELFKDVVETEVKFYK